MPHVVWWLQSWTAKAHISHISATNFFETKLSPETDSAGWKTSKTAFNLIFPRLLGDRQNFRSNHQYCIPDLGIVAEDLVARDLSFQIRVELAPDLWGDFVIILFFFHGIIFSYLKGTVSAFLLDFSEYFRGTAKFWRVENVNIDFNDDRLVPTFPLHPKDSISVISDTSGHFWSF